MKNYDIIEFRKPKPSKIEPTRTRPYIRFTCFHCKSTVEEAKSSFKEDKPCRKCVTRLRGKTNMIIKAKEKFGNQFTLHLDTYFSYTTPMTVTCNKHNHTYSIKPVHFVANSYDNQPHKGGCHKCANEINTTKNKKSINYYLQILNMKFPDLSVIHSGTAENNLEKIKLSCHIHGEFEKTLADLVKTDPTISNLCPTCSREALAWNIRQARTDIPGTVYFVHFEDVNLFKCGVTYKSVYERFRHLKNTSITPIWTLNFDTLSNAYFFEYQFFREYAKYRTSHPDTMMGGYTEFLSIGIPKPSKRFVEEILRRKESNSGKLPPPAGEDNPERSPIKGTCND